MDNLLIILLATFAGIAVLVMVLERTAKPLDEEQQVKLGGWMRIALVLLMLGLVIRFVMGE